MVKFIHHDMFTSHLIPKYVDFHIVDALLLIRKKCANQIAYTIYIRRKVENGVS